MSTQPCAAIKFRELDANGAPLSGGLLYTYVAGTTTPQATFTDSTGSVQNANPVVLDAAGRADLWLTPGVIYKFVLQDQFAVVQYTEDNFPSPTSTIGTTSPVATEPGGRLTLSSNPAFMFISEVSGATVVWYNPYKSNFVPLYDGTNWALASIGAGLQQATNDTTKSPAAAVASSNYDMFVWNDAGTIRCTRGPPWTSDTVRGTGVGTTQLQLINGRYMNAASITNGPAAGRGLYVGTIRTDGSANLNDLLTLRHVWNYHNRVPRTMFVPSPTATWTYATPTWRQANASAANQLDFVVGIDETPVQANVLAAAFTSAASNQVGTAIGVDSTTVPAAGGGTGGGLYSMPVITTPNTLITTFSASYLGRPGIGHHFLAWLEFATLATATFFGSVNGQYGISGSLMG